MNDLKLDSAVIEKIEHWMAANAPACQHCGSTVFVYKGAMTNNPGGMGTAPAGIPVPENVKPAMIRRLCRRCGNGTFWPLAKLGIEL